jgi:periplasmic protein TonB
VSVMTVDPYGHERAKDTALWSVAALVVAALHVGLVVGYLLVRPPPGDRAEAPVIDVAFMPAVTSPAPAAPKAQPAEPTPPVERSDLAPTKDKPVTPPEAVTEPTPAQQTAEPAPEPEPIPPPVAMTTPLPAPVSPEEPIVTVPPPKAAEPLPEIKKPATIPDRPAHKPVTDDKAAKEEHQAAPPKPAAAQASRPSRMASAPNAGADSEGAAAGRSSWESELAAHIRRYATYSANGSRDSGTARIGVTIDRNGRLLSHRLAGSSGSSTLDSAAMAVIERAQPYPRFPPGMSQAQVALTIPLHLRPQ